MSKTNNYDVIIIGAGYSGLSAALFLGNTRRPIALIDSGNTRNHDVTRSHNVLGVEGQNPIILLNTAKKEVSAFSNIKRYASEAIATEKLKNGEFSVTLANSETLFAKKLILATGLIDCLPNIPGTKDLWPHVLFHCPYCAAPDVVDMPLAVLSDNDEAFFMASVVGKWTKDLVLLTHGQNPLSSEQVNTLKERKVQIVSERIIKFELLSNNEVEIHFNNGNTLVRRGIFSHLPFEQRAPSLLSMLKCELTENNLVKVDENYQTNIEGLYAIGDMAMLIQKVTTAIASGTRVGFAIDHVLTE